MRISKTFLSLLLLIVATPAILKAQSLRLRLDGAQLKLTTPDFRFLTGEAVRQLHNGSSVNYVFRAQILASRNDSLVAETSYRFTISYDLWEEKYAVTRVTPAPRSVSHLSSAGAESWCLDSIALPTEKLGGDQPFWVVVEYQVVENQPSQNGEEESRFTLAGLVDIFSRRNQKKDLSGKKEGGPFRLSELRGAGGPRSGRR